MSNKPIHKLYLLAVFRDHSGYGLSQWEMMLQCNMVSHYLSPYPEWSLCVTSSQTINFPWPIDVHMYLRPCHHSWITLSQLRCVHSRKFSWINRLHICQHLGATGKFFTKTKESATAQRLITKKGTTILQLEKYHIKEYTFTLTSQGFNNLANWQVSWSHGIGYIQGWF